MMLVVVVMANLKILLLKGSYGCVYKAGQPRLDEFTKVILYELCALELPFPGLRCGSFGVSGRFEAQ